MRRSKKRALEALRELELEEERKEQQRLEQFELGERIFGELEKPVASNKAFNLLDGKPVKDVGPMRIWRIANNGGLYSVIIEIDCNRALQGSYPLYQIDVNLGDREKEIHVFTGPYGPSKYYAKQAVDLLIEKMAEVMAGYRLYKE